MADECDYEEDSYSERERSDDEWFHPLAVDIPVDLQVKVKANLQQHFHAGA